MSPDQKSNTSSELSRRLSFVVSEVGHAVIPFGFIKRKNVLEKQLSGNRALIEFQKSTKSSKDMLLFTINAAVILDSLLGGEGPSLSKARVVDAHLRQRVGEFLPGHPDKWWEITRKTDVNALAYEIRAIINDLIVPYICRYLEVDELLGLWKSGASPGLTDFQRLKYMDKLVTILNANE